MTLQRSGIELSRHVTYFTSMRKEALFMKITESATSTFWKGEQGIRASVQDGDSLYKVYMSRVVRFVTTLVLV